MAGVGGDRIPLGSLSCCRAWVWGSCDRDLEHPRRREWQCRGLLALQLSARVCTAEGLDCRQAWSEEAARTACLFLTVS